MDALIVLGVGRVAGDATAVRIGELEVDPRGHITVGRRAAHVKAAQLLLAAGVETVVRRSHIAAKSTDVPQLRAQRQHVVPFFGKLQVMHGDELLVRHDRVDIADAAPNA